MLPAASVWEGKEGDGEMGTTDNEKTEEKEGPRTLPDSHTTQHLCWRCKYEQCSVSLSDVARHFVAFH